MGGGNSGPQCCGDFMQSMVSDSKLPPAHLAKTKIIVQDLASFSVLGTLW